MTSPIPTEEALFRSREPRCGGSTTETGQPITPEDPSSGNLPTCSNTAGKKRKKRRKKHKVEPRKEEQASPAGGEVELCELSSDEDNTHSSQWLVTALGLRTGVVLLVVKLRHFFRFLSLGRPLSPRRTTWTTGNIPHSLLSNGTATLSLTETGPLVLRKPRPPQSLYYGDMVKCLECAVCLQQRDV